MKNLLIMSFFVLSILAFYPIEAKCVMKQVSVTPTGGEKMTGGNYTNYGMIGDTIVLESLSGENYTTNVGFLFATNEPVDFKVSGFVLYTGNDLGMLIVDAFKITDTTFSNPIGSGASYDWLSGESDKLYQITVPVGTYSVRAFIDVPDSMDELNGLADSCEPVGKYPQTINDEKNNCNFSISAPASCVIMKGDVDSNGQVQLIDVKLAFGFFIGAPYSNNQFIAANVCDDGDGNKQISLKDVKNIFKLFMGSPLICE